MTPGNIDLCAPGVRPTSSCEARPGSQCPILGRSSSLFRPLAATTMAGASGSDRITVFYDAPIWIVVAFRAFWAATGSGWDVETHRNRIVGSLPCLCVDRGSSCRRKAGLIRKGPLRCPRWSPFPTRRRPEPGRLLDRVLRGNAVKLYSDETALPNFV